MLLYFIALLFRDKRDSRTTRRSAPSSLLPLKGIDVLFFSSLPDQPASTERLSSDRETSGHSCPYSTMSFSTKRSVSDTTLSMYVPLAKCCTFSLYSLPEKEASATTLPCIS